MADELTLTTNVGPLDRLGALLTAEVERALTALKDETVADAQGRCPVKTGVLKASISGSVATGETSVTATLVAAAPYAGYVDMGTRKMAARPFFTPAVDQARTKVGELVSAAFDKALKASR